MLHRQSDRSRPSCCQKGVVRSELKVADIKNTSCQRYRQSFSCTFICLPICDHQNIKSGKEESGNIGKTLAFHKGDQSYIAWNEYRKKRGEKDDHDVT